MKITKIESQKNKERVNIYIDDSFAFGLSLEISYKYDLKEDMAVSQEWVENVLKSEELNKGKNYALNLLSYRWRTEKEIIDRMSEKGYEKEIIENTVLYLKDQNLINDRRFAEIYFEEKSKLNGLGIKRIRYELSMKGISKEILEEVVNEESDEEFERALELANKKISSYKNDSKEKIYRKLGGYLQRKGYSYDCIRNVLNKILF